MKPGQYTQEKQNQIQRCPRVANLNAHNIQGNNLNQEVYSILIWQVLSSATRYAFHSLYYSTSPMHANKIKLVFYFKAVSIADL